MKAPNTCGHNKHWKERCIDCEIVSAKEGLKWAEENVIKYKNKLENLEKLKNND